MFCLLVVIIGISSEGKVEIIFDKLSLTDFTSFFS